MLSGALEYLFSWRYCWMEHEKLLIMRADSSCVNAWIWWGTLNSTTFPSAMKFKVLDQLENLTPVWKSINFELPSLSCLNDLKRLSSVICFRTKDLLLHRPRYYFAIFVRIYLNVNYFSAIIWKGKEKKVNWEDLSGLCFDSTIVFHLDSD